VILLKNDEVIDFLTSPPTDFSALKYVSAEMLFNFPKKTVYQVTVDDVTVTF